MKHTKSLLASMLAFGLSSAAHATDLGAGSGTIKFSGAIIEAPCSIINDSLDQSIALGQVSMSTLSDGKSSKAVPFTIGLSGCKFAEPATSSFSNNKITVTFDGTKVDGNDTMLKINGEGAGAGVMIEDVNGKVVKFGDPTDAIELTGENSTLKFNAYLKAVPVAAPNGQPAAPALVAGEFQAEATFTLAYN